MTDDLLDEILANPRHTALRRVYADTLLERGDVRGEFIQVACARGPMIGERALQHAALLARATSDWRTRWRLEPVFERGFVRKVLGTAEAMVAARDVLAREPIDEISVVPGDALPALLALPVMARVATLLVDRPISDRDARVLAAAPLPALRALQIAPGAVTRPAAVALGRASWAPRLQKLTVYAGSQSVYPEMLAELGALTTLDVSGSRLADDLAACLRPLPHLASCTLSGNHLGVTGARALVAVRLERLGNLAVDFEDLGESGVREIAEARAWPVLRRLSIASNNAGNDAIAALAGSPVCDNLVELDVGGNHLTARGVGALADSPHLARLKFLELRWTMPDLEIARHVAAGLPALERLGLGSVTDEVRALFVHRPSVRLL